MNNLENDIYQTLETIDKNINKMNKNTQRLRDNFIMMKNNITKRQLKKIKKIIKNGLSHYQTDNTQSDYKLIDTMLSINIQDDTIQDLMTLLEVVRVTNDYTTREQLNKHMWNTIELYYKSLKKILNTI